MNPYQLYKNLIHNPKTRWVVIILTLVYFFMPLDLVPEVILGPFGLIDDGVVLSILVVELLSIFRQKNKKDGEMVDGEVKNEKV